MLPYTRRQWCAALGLGALGSVLPARASTAAVQRLIALGGAMTEVVYALGAEDLLVATDTTSLYPEAATRTPKVGYLRQLPVCVWSWCPAAMTLLKCCARLTPWGA